MLKLLTALAVTTTLATPALAKTRAVVIGIDAYRHAPVLAGAVNDAEDVANALRQAQADEVVTFFNEEASNSKIRAALFRLADGMGQGDTLIMHYAGHGAQMEEQVAGSEPDGKDEFLWLADFDANRKEETRDYIIVDNELNQWFRDIETTGVRVLYVSDSCHSGGMNRSVTGTFRLAPPVAGPAPAPNADSIKGATLVEKSFLSTTILAASLESQLTPEVTIDDKPRGALSWSFARALEGNADADKDGILSRIELEDYVFANVKSQAEALQEPNFTPVAPRSEKEVVFEFARGLAVAPAKAAVPTWEAGLPVKIIGGPPAPLAHVRPPVADSYVWDAANQRFITPNGDIAAHNVTVDKLQTVVDKFVVLEFFKWMASRSPAKVAIDPFKDLYVADDQFKFSTEVDGFGSLLVFNLANNGEVQFIHAEEKAAGQLAFRLPPIKVVEPFGADHLIVLALKQPNPSIVSLIQKSGVTTSDLLNALPPRLKGLEPGDFKVGIAPLYTRKK